MCEKMFPLGDVNDASEPNATKKNKHSMALHSFASVLSSKEILNLRCCATPLLRFSCTFQRTMLTPILPCLYGLPVTLHQMTKHDCPLQRTRTPVSNTFSIQYVV